MNRDEIIEQAARVLSTHETFTGKPHPREHHRRQARALADAGLLAQPLPDPEPGWLDAPAVLATCGCRGVELWHPHDSKDGVWVSVGGEHALWSSLREVTPLYPKEDA